MATQKSKQNISPERQLELELHKFLAGATSDSIATKIVDRLTTSYGTPEALARTLQGIAEHYLAALAAVPPNRKGATRLFKQLQTEGELDLVTAEGRKLNIRLIPTKGEIPSYQITFADGAQSSPVMRITDEQTIDFLLKFAK